LHVWLQPVANREYLAAVDPAGGETEGDYSAVEVIDLATGLQCAELRGKLGPLELAYEASALAREYNNALLVVERNNHGSGVLAYPLQEEVLWAFSLPGAWTTVDPSTVDFVADTGELIFPLFILGLPYNEVSVTYTAGLATIPSAVKCACAQIVKNAQATPGLNVKSSKVDTLQLEYFSGALIDPTVQSMLRPWVSVRMG
jgi:hypothetical protein